MKTPGIRCGFASSVIRIAYNNQLSLVQSLAQVQSDGESLVTLASPLTLHKFAAAGVLRMAKKRSIWTSPALSHARGQGIALNPILSNDSRAEHFGLVAGYAFPGKVPFQVDGGGKRRTDDPGRHDPGPFRIAA